jgi:hypothetical protein
MTATQTAPSAAPATTPTEVNPAQGATNTPLADQNAPTPAPIDTEAEEKLTATIIRLWVDHKGSKAVVKRTRVESKALKLELSANLHLMKAILVRTGRSGGWASYLRAQHLPLSSADRLVAEHEATLAPLEEKVPNGEVSTVTIAEVQTMARKMASKLDRLLTSQELVYAYVHELLWNLDVAEVTDTDDGLEIPRTSQDDSDDAEDEAAKSAVPALVA